MEQEILKIDKNLPPREAILNLEQSLIKKAGTTLGDNEERCPLKHTFGDGTYVREMFIPKGTPLSGKIHKHACTNILVSGDITVFTEEGEKRIQGPCTFVSPPGVKRIGFAHEDTIWINVHSNPDNETDLSKIEQRVIAKDYGEYDKLIKQKGMGLIDMPKISDKENCGLVALKNLTPLEKISIASLVAIAKDNGLDLYAYRIPLDRASNVSLPAIFHTKDHFVYVSSVEQFDPSLDYTGAVLLTTKSKYSEIKKSEQKQITGGSWAAAIGASVAITGQVIGYKAEAEAAKSECERACDTTCKEQTKGWEFNKRKECKSVCKEGCFQAVVDPAAQPPKSTSNFKINPYYATAAVIIILIILYFIFRKRLNLTF